MDDFEIFKNGGFSPSWLSEPQRDEQLTTQFVYHRENKDLYTLKKELNSIKEYIQDINARQWQISKLIQFHENNLARD